MTPQIKSLGDMSGASSGAMPPLLADNDGAHSGGGGGGGAQEGLDQIYSGAGTVGNAVNTAAQALGGGGGYVSPKPVRMFKKGGYVSKGGKLNLGSGRVSTTSKNKSNSNW